MNLFVRNPTESIEKRDIDLLKTRFFARPQKTIGDLLIIP